MGRQAVLGIKIFRFVAAGIALMALTSCALFFGGDEDVGSKSNRFSFTEPKEPYRRINVTSADAVWQSDHTGNTIAVNSLCKKSESRDLKDLNENLFSGVESLKINSQKDIQINGVAGVKTLATGQTEGVPIEVEVVTFRKGDCTYDLTYVARKQTFNQETRDFDRFVGGFKAP